MRISIRIFVYFQLIDGTSGKRIRLLWTSSQLFLLTWVNWLSKLWLICDRRFLACCLSPRLITAMTNMNYCEYLSLSTVASQMITFNVFVLIKPIVYKPKLSNNMFATCLPKLRQSIWRFVKKMFHIIFVVFHHQIFIRQWMNYNFFLVQTEFRLVIQFCVLISVVKDELVWNVV